MTSRRLTSWNVPAHAAGPAGALGLARFVAVFAVLMCALAFAGCAPSGPEATVSFEGGDAQSGAVSDIKTHVGDTITLPENGFQSMGCVFGGWVEKGKEGAGEPLAAGSKVKVEGDTTYVAAWNVEVTFDGNGADGGSLEAQTVRKGTEITLPACGFTRSGYYFSHWTTNKGSGVGTIEYPAGQAFTASHNVTFFANWVTATPVAEATITKAGEVVEGAFDTFDESVSNCALLVHNKSDEPLTLRATFAFSASGYDRGTYDDEAVAVAPGGFAILIGLDMGRSSGASYKVTGEKPQDGFAPLEGNVTFEEASANGQSVVKMTNTGKGTVNVFKVRVLATSQNGEKYVYNALPGANTLAPGASTEAVIEAKSLAGSYAGGQLAPPIETMERLYYVGGYVNGLQP